MRHVLVRLANQLKIHSLLLLRAIEAALKRMHLTLQTSDLARVVCLNIAALHFEFLEFLRHPQEFVFGASPPCNIDREVRVQIPVPLHVVLELLLDPLVVDDHLVSLILQVLGARKSLLLNADLAPHLI